MERNDYIQIQASMVTELGLSGNQLIIYALVHGFCKDGIHEFKGSINYICEWTNLSRNTVISILKQLVEDGLLVKRTYKENNVTFCAYSVGSEKIALPVQKFGEGSEIIEPNNTIHNTIEKKDKEKSLSKKTTKDELFETCWLAYRRKGKMGKAYPYWKKLSEKEKTQVLPHIRAYVQTRDLQYQQDFERYLRDKTFLSLVFKNSTVIYDPTRLENGEYAPQGRTIWFNEETQSYWSFDNFYDERIYDGYDDENRPDGAEITLNNGRGRIQWDAETKKWIKK